MAVCTSAISVDQSGVARVAVHVEGTVEQFLPTL